MGQLMKNSRNLKQSRREFIKVCLRYGAGGGLFVIGAYLGFRKENPEDSPNDCTLKDPCQGCSKYAGCKLPRAQNVKQNEIKATI